MRNCEWLLLFLFLALPACGDEESPDSRTFLERPASYWAGALCSQDAEVRLHAREQLIGGGLSSLPVLLSLTSDPSPGVATEIGTVLRDMGPDVVDALKKIVGQVGSRRAAEAAEALGYMGPAATAAIPGLIALMESSEEHGRAEAAWALGQIGGAEDEQMGKALRKALKGDDDEQVRMWAALGLGLIGDAREETVLALMTGLEDASREVVLSCIEALGSLGPEAGKAVPTLIALLTMQNDRQVRWAAAKALGELGCAAESAIPALEIATKDAPQGVEPPAVAALRQIRAAMETKSGK